MSVERQKRDRVILHREGVVFQYRLGQDKKEWLDGPDYVRTVHEMRAYLAGKLGRHTYLCIRRIDYCSKGWQYT